MRNTALITGASSGIGLELAKIHASKKGDLVLVARSTNKLNDLKKELEAKEGVEVLVIPKDLSIPDAAAEVYEEIKESGLTIDYLINNAGIGDYGLFHTTDWYKNETMINLNILALTQLTWLIGADMVERKSGKILNISSVAAFLPGPTMNVYYASKHYVQAFSEGLYNEWKDLGVTVTALCPGPTKSGFHRAAGIFKKESDMASAADVAKAGYEAMVNGKMMAVPGLQYALLTETLKFVPKKLLMKTLRRLKEKANALS